MGRSSCGRALKEDEIQCGRHRVARLRKLAGLEARCVRRFRVIVEHPPAAVLRTRHRGIDYEEILV
ncbi:MAG TPA: hypothetical protein VFB56_09210 [Nitrospiraceae bacterium]|nr:hypothetical protein [Nitrospiraceae bacterium]